MVKRLGGSRTGEVITIEVRDSKNFVLIFRWIELPTRIPVLMWGGGLFGTFQMRKIPPRDCHNSVGMSRYKDGEQSFLRVNQELTGTAHLYS